MLTIAESRCPIDFIAVTGDLVDASYISRGDRKAYRRLLQEGFRFLEKTICESISFRDRTRVLLVSGSHDPEAVNFRTKLRVTLDQYIAETCRFYGDQLAWHDKGWYDYIHYFGTGNFPVGFLPLPARIGFLVFQGEPGFRTDMKFDEDGLNKLRDHRRDTRDCCLTMGQRALAERLLETAGARGSDDAFALVSISHRPVRDKMKPPGDEGECAENDDQKMLLSSMQDRAHRLLVDYRFALHLCGHEHDAGVRPKPVPQPICCKASAGFQLLEFRNCYPHAPAVEKAQLFAFQQADGKRWRTVSSDIEMPGGSVRPCRALPLFRTVHCKHREQKQDLRRYIELFEGDEDGEHCCPYADVYTRYLPWIFDTADPRAPDVLCVPHVGPILEWLDEPMNLEYFRRQWKSCEEGRVRVARLWLVPVRDWGNGRYSDASYGVDYHGPEGGRRRVADIPLGSEIRAVLSTLRGQDVSSRIEAAGLLVGPEPPLNGYESFGATPTLLAHLLEEDVPRVAESLEQPKKDQVGILKEWLQRECSSEHLRRALGWLMEKLRQEEDRSLWMAFAKRGDDVLCFRYNPEELGSASILLNPEDEIAAVSNMYVILNMLCNATNTILRNGLSIEYGGFTRLVGYEFP